jgi:hypothetical protein
MLIQVITGQETFEAKLGYGGTVKVMAFARTAIHKEDGAIGVLARDRHGGVQQVGSDEWINACPANKHHGQWITSRYQIPAGAFVRLMISRKEYGDMIQKSKHVVLYLRDDAAQRRLRINFTGHPEAALPCGYIEGVFDILTPQELDQFGYTIPDHFRKSYEIDDYSELFDDEILAAARQPLIIPTVESVTTTKGREVRIARPVSRRKLNLS